MKKTVWLLVSLLMVAALVLSACAGDTTDEPADDVFVSPHTTPERAAVAMDEVPKYGGTLKMLGYDATGWDPITTGQAEYSQPVLSRMIIFDWWKGPAGTNEWPFNLPGAMPPTNIFMGDLAESWEMLSYQSVVYRLKEGVMWQDKPGIMDAREVVAEDLIYNYWRMTNTPTHALGNTATIQRITSMTAIDDYTIEFTYGYPGYWFPVLSLGTMYGMIPPEVIEQFGDMTDWRNVTGSGPFMLTDYVSGSVIEYKSNPNWHIKDPEGRSMPYIDGFDVLIIYDPATVMTAIRSGQVDMIYGYSMISWANAEELWDTSPELNWVQKASGTPVKLVFDMKGPPFGPSDDPDALKIRRAASMAIDRQSIVDGYEQGHADIYTTFMAPIYEVEELELENLPPSTRELFEYNPDEARRLLAEAGRPSIKTKIQFPSYAGDYFSMIKDNWDAVGIETELDPIDAGALAALQYSHTMTDVLMQYGGLAFDSGYQWFHFTHPVTEELVASPMNPGSAFNELINDLTGNLDQTPDPQERMDIATEIQLEGISQVYDIIMPIPHAYNFWQPWVRGYHGEENVTAYMPRSLPAFIWLDDDYR